MPVNYKHAKELLKRANAQSITELEQMLENDGFKEKILPLNLSAINWYFENIKSKPLEERMDEIAAYARGFIRRKGNLIAAYGITKIKDMHPDQPNQDDDVFHFFYIKENNSHLLEFLTYNALWAGKIARGRLPNNIRQILFYKNKTHTPRAQSIFEPEFGAYAIRTYNRKYSGLFT